MNGRQIPGLQKFGHRLNMSVAYQMTFLEQVAMTDVATETGTACYSGALMLQALGLGGWMYTGINPFVILGASGDPAVAGLGFQFRMLEGNPLPYITGLPGMFEAHVPPHHADMRAAVEAVVARKFSAPPGSAAASTSSATPLPMPGRAGGASYRRSSQPPLRRTPPWPAPRWALLLEQNDEWSVQRARYMTLENHRTDGR